MLLRPDSQACHVDCSEGFTAVPGRRVCVPSVPLLRPEFTSQIATLSVNETASPGDYVLADLGTFSNAAAMLAAGDPVAFSLVPSGTSPETRFVLPDPSVLRIAVGPSDRRQPLDYEDEALPNPAVLTVRADALSGAHATASLIVEVLDVQERPLLLAAPNDIMSVAQRRMVHGEFSTVRLPVQDIFQDRDLADQADGQPGMHSLGYEVSWLNPAISAYESLDELSANLFNYTLSVVSPSKLPFRGELVFSGTPLYGPPLRLQSPSPQSPRASTLQLRVIARDRANSVAIAYVSIEVEVAGCTVPSAAWHAVSHPHGNYNPFASLPRPVCVFPDIPLSPASAGGERVRVRLPAPGGDPEGAGAVELTAAAGVVALQGSGGGEITSIRVRGGFAAASALRSFEASDSKAANVLVDAAVLLGPAGATFDPPLALRLYIGQLPPDTSAVILLAKGAAVPIEHDEIAFRVTDKELGTFVTTPVSALWAGTGPETSEAIRRALVGLPDQLVPSASVRRVAAGQRDRAWLVTLTSPSNSGDRVSIASLPLGCGEAGCVPRVRQMLAIDTSGTTGTPGHVSVDAATAFRPLSQPSSPTVAFDTTLVVHVETGSPYSTYRVSTRSPSSALDEETGPTGTLSADSDLASAPGPGMRPLVVPVGNGILLRFSSLHPDPGLYLVDLVADRASSRLAFPVLCGLLASVYFGTLGADIETQRAQPNATTSAPVAARLLQSGGGAAAGGEQQPAGDGTEAASPFWYEASIACYAVCALGVLAATSAYQSPAARAIGFALAGAALAVFATLLGALDTSRRSAATLTALYSAATVMSAAVLIAAWDMVELLCWSRQPWQAEVDFSKGCRLHVAALLRGRPGHAGLLSASPIAQAGDVPVATATATHRATGQAGVSSSRCVAPSATSATWGKPRSDSRCVPARGIAGCCWRAGAEVFRQFDHSQPAGFRFPQRVLACVFAGILSTIVAFVVFRESGDYLVAGLKRISAELSVVQQTLTVALDNAAIVAEAVGGPASASAQVCANATQAVRAVIADPSLRNPSTLGDPQPLNMSSCVPEADPGAPPGMYAIHCGCAVLQDTQRLVDQINSASAPGGGLDAVFSSVDVAADALRAAYDFSTSVVLVSLLLHWANVLPRFRRMLAALRQGRGVGAATGQEMLEFRVLAAKLTEAGALSTGVGVVPGRFSTSSASSQGFRELHVPSGWYVNDLSVLLVTTSVYNALFSSILLSAVLTLLVFVVTWQPTMLLLVRALPAMVTSLILVAVDLVLRYCVVRPFFEEGTRLSRPRCFALYELASIGINGFSGPIVATTRMLLGIGTALLVSVRPDMQLFPTLSSFDSVHAPFISALLAEHRHNNPVLRVNTCAASPALRTCLDQTP
ncbi:hypothetical protein FNF27_02428 [Cafeteria roenbergensis]|uniref:Cadherin domain-containing protein n=1 Tax=Cafeteria roenbergensis TaxID=33653 RepID=A0A5A8EDZ0_CAFRO|nr:hypothetical protein FNF27_02428 [Cafeteria roenbergensis]